MSAHALTSRPESRLIPTAVVVAVLVAAGGGWLILTGRMAGMDAGPGGDPGALGWFVVSWTVMTAAMMLPAAAAAVARLVRGWRRQAPAAAVLFVTGYVAVWIAAGLAGYAAVEAIRGLHAGILGWSAAGRYVAGAAVTAAGLYQLTGVKRRWLARCVAPERLWRGELGGPGGATTAALRAGLEHGGCCVACCWTLMAALYALGIMSITWMVVVTALIVGERVAPRTPVVRAVAGILVALGLALAIAPASVPGLTIPAHARPMTMAMR